MTFQEIQEVEDVSQYFDLSDIEVIEDDYSINKLIALPILTSHSFDRSQEVIVKTLKGLHIGKILFLKQFKTEDIRSLPEEKLICFFKEYQAPQITEENYQFQYDYLLVKKRNYKSYNKNFKKTSALWGSYFHIEDVPSISFEKRNSSNELRLTQDLNVGNLIYFENLFLSINEPNPFNRFLKLYHLIELQFDMHTAEKIVDLHNQGHKEKEISGLLKEYQKEDLNRLTSIIRHRCIDIEGLVICINGIKSFQNKAKKIFYDYGRESNPLKQADFNTIIDNSDLFSEATINSIGGYNYNILIQKLCSYWIYRIRSSISHNKFGEYIMDKHDEEFIVEFAEPLLKQIVIQCFKK
jgi:hypothetical protein